MSNSLTDAKTYPCVNCGDNYTTDAFCSVECAYRYDMKFRYGEKKDD